MAEATETPSRKPARLRKTWLWLLIGLLCLGTGALGFRVSGFFKSNKAPQTETRERGNDSEVKSIWSLEPFLVNLADKDEVRFVKVTFHLGMTEIEAGEDLSKNAVTLSVARDAIITILSSKTADEILLSDGKLRLREEIRNRLNSILPKTKVAEVYIVDFVVQL